MNFTTFQFQHVVCLKSFNGSDKFKPFRLNQIRNIEKFINIKSRKVKIAFYLAFRIHI